MPVEKEQRPDPDYILENIRDHQTNQKGKLKIFFGYAAGVGKTYAMLDDAQEQLKSGVDVVVGYIEPHTRPETIKLLEGLPSLPPIVIQYKNITLKEFDLDAALKRKPELILVDELAHSNAEGVRNKKRYQDVEELLNAGINVYTTINVQHIESLNDIVQDITKINVKETVPDYIFDNADTIRLIDIGADELLKRFEEGKVYRPERVKIAVENFFTNENMRLLREIAMRKIADRISSDNQKERRLSEKMSNVKMLVCISSSPSSAKCIRWTARTAEAFHAPWVALYVENMDSAYFTEDEKKNIRANMDLAEILGAEIVTLNGDDIATVIAEYAKIAGITNIVIGKSRNKKSIKNFFEADLEDQLISMLSSVEVHIIPGNLTQKAFRKPKRIRLRKMYLSWRDMLKTLIVLTAATLFSMGLRKIGIGDQNIIMVYILSVLVVSRITMGYFYGILASVISVLAFNFFFTVPYYTFNTIQPGYPVTFAIMLLAALITSALTVRVKLQARTAVERERRTEVLYEINRKLLATRGLKNIAEVMNEYISKIFNCSVIFYTKEREDISKGILKQSSAEENSSFLLSEDERAVAHWVLVNQKEAGAGTDTLMGAGGFYLPVISQGSVLGVIGLSCLNGELKQNNRFFLRMIVSLTAMALERQYLSNEQHRILIDSEKEKMRGNLLRAISHDLRTPLTCILGAVSTIIEGGKRLDRKTHDELALNIKEDSQWLIRMVENLLSVTRIDENMTNVAKEPEAAEEIIAGAVSRIRKRYPGRKIIVKVPDELLMVPMDATLIEQVLINLIENAVMHSLNDTTINLELNKHENFAVFEVSDCGKGIAEEDLPYLFDSYIPNGKRSTDSSRGMGIGLSICMSIIKAHHGKMEAVNKIGGGAIFRFMLPLSEGEDDEK